jgi:hypothetical protein
VTGRQVIGRISRLLWRSLKDVSGSQAQIWPAANTVTEPIGIALIHLALRTFLKQASGPEDNARFTVADDQELPWSYGEIAKTTGSAVSGPPVADQVTAAV